MPLQQDLNDKEQDRSRTRGKKGQNIFNNYYN